METRSRKRAEASSSAPSSQAPTTRAPKRSRTSAASASTTPPALPPAASTCSRRAQNRVSASTVAPSPMDSSASDSGGRRRSSSGKNHHPPAERDRESSDKGKEREPEASRARDRDRDVERILGLSFDGAGADDDNDSEVGVGILHQNLTSAGSALQGLLRKLGAGLDDLLPSSAVSGSSSSHQSGRLKKILSGLRSDGEEGRQVEALTQLCEMLSIGTEDSLGSFSVDSFVPVLVGLLNHECNPDIMLLAARALTHLCDVLPSSCSAVVRYGAVPCFCARLLTIEYMDLAEQSLQALKKISQEHPTACLRAGALMAVLSYLDFFSTGVQRVALSTAANMCKKLPSDAADFVMEAVPLLTNLLNYHDSKVLEHASVCLTRIAEAFASSPEKLDELCNHGLVAQAAGLISIGNSGGQASLSTSTYTGLIRLLSTCASGSPLGAKTLLLLGISGTLKNILSGSGLVAGVSVFPALTRPAEQGPSLAKELDSGSRNEDGVGYNTSTAKKARLQSMLSALLDDPILSDVPKKPTLADVDTLINLELGSAMKISIVKMDNTSFDVAALNSATVKDLKLAIRKKINEIEQARMGHRHISWRHIWANFCLVHHNEKLIDDNSLLRDNGIRNNSKVIFSPYVMSRESQKHSRRRTHRLFRRSCIELQASFF